MKSVLSTLAFLGALSALVVGSANVQKLPDDVLNVLFGIAVSLVLLILVIFPWMKNHTKPSLSEASGI